MRKDKDPRTGRPIDWQLCSCTTYCSNGSSSERPTTYDLIHRYKRERKRVMTYYIERFSDGDDYVIAELAVTRGYFTSLDRIEYEKHTGRFVETVDGDNWYHVPHWKDILELPRCIHTEPLDVSFMTHAALG